MDLLFPDEGLVYQLQQILTPGVRYRLFTAPAAITLGQTLASLTEAAWSGYVPVLQHWSDYAGLSGVSGHNGFGIAAPISFNNTSAVPVSAYGYYVTDPAGPPTKLLAIALFDNPPVNIPAGGSTTVVPTWGDFSFLAS